jgi:hypothetical protein
MSTSVRDQITEWFENSNLAPQGTGQPSSTVGSYSPFYADLSSGANPAVQINFGYGDDLSVSGHTISSITAAASAAVAAGQLSQAAYNSLTTALGTVSTVLNTSYAGTSQGLAQANTALAVADQALVQSQNWSGVAQTVMDNEYSNLTIPALTAQLAANGITFSNLSPDMQGALEDLEFNAGSGWFGPKIYSDLAASNYSAAAFEIAVDSTATTNVGSLNRLMADAMESLGLQPTLSGTNSITSLTPLADANDDTVAGFIQDLATTSSTATGTISSYLSTPTGSAMYSSLVNYTTSEGFHVVMPGDTAASIAQLDGTDAATLQQLNTAFSNTSFTTGGVVYLITPGTIPISVDGSTTLLPALPTDQTYVYDPNSQSIYQMSNCLAPYNGALYVTIPGSDPVMIASTGTSLSISQATVNSDQIVTIQGTDTAGNQYTTRIDSLTGGGTLSDDGTIFTFSDDQGTNTDPGVIITALPSSGVASDLPLGNWAAAVQLGSAALLVTPGSSQLTGSIASIDLNVTAADTEETITAGGGVTVDLGGTDNLLNGGTADTVISNGTYGTVNLGSGATVTDTGTDNTVYAGASATVNLGGDFGTDILGNNATVTDNTANNTITTGANSNVTVDGDNTTVTNTGTGCTDGIHCIGDVVDSSGNTIGEDSSDSSVTVNGSDDSISQVASSTLDIDGSANTIASGSSDTLVVTGNSDTLTLGSSGSVTFSGTSDVLDASGDAGTLDAGAQVTVVGSADVLGLVGTGASVTASSDTIDVAAGITVSASGTDDIITGGTNDTVWLSGAGDLVNATTGDVVALSTSTSATVAGNSETIDLEGTSDVLTATGTNDSVNIYDNGAYVVASNDAVTMAAGGLTVVDVNGNSDTLTDYANDTVWLSGASKRRAEKRSVFRLLP